MVSGLASESTRKLILGSGEKERIITPRSFWCGNSLGGEEDCCFWHYIFYPNRGPERDGVFHPLYDYEKQILQALQEHKHICVYKATGLGITEFMLLWTLWKCFTDPFFKGKEAIFITGPNVDLAQDLIRRTKRFLYDKDLGYVDKGVYSLSVNECLIKCYPSNNIASARGRPKVSLFFGDEAAFFQMKDDTVVQTVGERYIGKSDSWVVWVSTAGEEPEGFFYTIMLETEAETIYKMIHMYVEAGLKKDPVTNTSIFTPEYIAKASRARSYPREYLGQWGKNVGDIFPQELLDEITSHDYDINSDDQSFDRVMGIDPGFGSSEFGIVVMERSGGGKFTVVAAESYQRASYFDMIDKCVSLAKKFHTRKAYIDKSWPEGIKDLRDKHHFDTLGIAFNEHGQKMIDFAADKFEQCRIHPMFKKLKFQLQTIKFNSKGLPDKTDANSFDLGDAFLLALYYYKLGSGIIVGVY